CELGLEMLSRGVAAQSLWDAALVGASELLMRQPGIVPLHAMTTSNALHYAYLATEDEETRKLALLQNLAFVTLFREAAGRRGARAAARRSGRSERGARAPRRTRPRDRRRQESRIPRRGRRCPATHSRRPSADVPQREQRPRLQVQFGGSRRLLPRRPHVAG